jgi:DNA uptake protein ComE-like DNA-binding protein
MKKPLLFALSAGALGYFAYTTGIFDRVFNRIRRSAPDFEQRTGVEQSQVRSDRRRFRRRGATHITAEGLLDLNSASQQELQGLQGIGPELAEKILENRPYLTKIDLVGRMVVPDLIYEEIKGRVTVRPKAA